MSDKAFENKVSRILVTFPIPVEVEKFMGVISSAVSGICKENVPEGMTMWPGGHGLLITKMPMTAQDDLDGVEVEFDEGTYHIEVNMRERSERERRPRDTRKPTWPEDADRAL